MLINLNKMKYIKRKSNAVEYPKLVEYLQGGILLRFNITKVIPESDEEMESYNYDEFWVEKTATVDEIRNLVEQEGFELTDDYTIK